MQCNLVSAKIGLGVRIVAQWKWIWLASMRTQVWILASLTGLRIQHCRERWCRSQMWLGSGVAVAVAKASSCSSDLTPSLGTFICPKKTKKKKNRTNFLISCLFSQKQYSEGEMGWRTGWCCCSPSDPIPYLEVLSLKDHRILRPLLIFQRSTVRGSHLWDCISNSPGDISPCPAKLAYLESTYFIYLRFLFFLL